MKKMITFSEEQLKIVKKAMLFIHKELNKDIISQDEEILEEFEGTMEVLGLIKDEDFNSLIPEYKRLFP